MYLVVTGDGFLGTYIDDNLKEFLALGKNGYVITTIVTATIDDVRAISICAASLGGGLAGSIVCFFILFFITSGNQVLCW